MCWKTSSTDDRVGEMLDMMLQYGVVSVVNQVYFLLLIRLVRSSRTHPPILARGADLATVAGTCRFRR